MEEKLMPGAERSLTGQNQPIRLPVEDQRRLVETLINPPAPNEALQRATQLHAETVEIRSDS